MNVRFGHVSQFEFSTEMLVFDLFGIKLRHGWVIDPSQTETYRVMHSLSYNQAIEKVIAAKSDANITNPDVALIEVENKEKRKKKKRNKSLFIYMYIHIYLFVFFPQRFLSENPSQLTYYGLHQLYADLAEGECVVLFRNNHFSTMVKVRSELYVLCTDIGYLAEPFSVWEKLSAV